MVSGPSTSWEIEAEKEEAVIDFLFCGSTFTVNFCDSSFTMVMVTIKLEGNCFLEENSHKFREHVKK